MRNLSFKFLFLFALTSTLFNCAKRGTPTGGAKDSIPPVMVKAVPEIETINFKAKRIKIYFDEYIKLKDVSKNLVISPPQKNDPEISPVGTASKFVSIKIKDTLDSNTTYLFNFGKSIIDNNEENELGNFKYVFSTGDYIDSLIVKGKVTDLTTKKSATEIDVMLYEYDSLYTDSIIYKQKPRYITNTLDSTLYDLTNLRAGKYLMIALKDANSNKIYDPKIDKIGFISDTIVLPTTEEYNFSIFREIPEIRVIKPKEVTKGHLIFGYLGDGEDLSIKLLSEVEEGFISESNFEKNKDTINYWHSPIEADSLNFEVSKNDYIDTLTVHLRSSTIDTLKVSQSVSGVLNPLDTLKIITNNPIVKIDTSKIKIVDQDTLNIKYKTTLLKSKTQFKINFDKQYDSKYRIEILPDAITDLFGMVNDTLNLNLSTKNPEDYGELNFTITSQLNSSFIVELLTEKGEVVRTQKTDKPEAIRFKFLKPSNYVIKVTIDENNNGIWDTGSFLDKRQPEKIQYFDKTLEIRANWDLNEIMNIN